MFRNHLLTAFRQLTKHKLYTSISLLGLAVSLACCLLMAVYLREELTYDRFHQDFERIYRVVFDNYFDLGAYASTPLPVGPALEQEFPEVEAMTRLSTGLRSLVRYEDRGFFETLVFADSALTDLFTLEVSAGDAREALSLPNRVMISRSTARKYFGEEDPIGKMLHIGSSGSLNSEVSAVFEDLPSRSHISFELVLPFVTFEKAWGKEATQLWDQMPRNYTYLRLSDGVRREALAAKLPQFAQRRRDRELEDPAGDYRLALQPLADIHLRSDLNNEFEVNGSLRVIFLFFSIALVVLLVAGINYVNYALAGFSKRAREIGLRKIIGARRGQLISQLLVETLLLVLLAAALARIFAEIALPILNLISGNSFQHVDLNHWFLFAGLGLLVLIIGLAAGIVPALLLSGFKPIEALRNRFLRLPASAGLRNFLVVGQFVASGVLIAATGVVFLQYQYMRSRIRQNPDAVVMVFQINNNLAGKFEVLRHEISKVPGVYSVAASSNVPTFYGDSWPVARELNAEPVQTENYVISDDFLKTLGYELIAGRSLSSENLSDVSSGFLLNETAVRQLGFDSPEAALGQSIVWGGEDTKKKGIVAGVLQDFHFESLHEPIQAALMQFAPFDWLTYNFVAVRSEARHLERKQLAIGRAIAALDPNWIADIQYLDDSFVKLHQQDLRQGRVFGAFALLALFISCFGLFGLSAFSARQRTKEMGIRKVLGATVRQIALIHSTEFLKLVGWAFLFTLPLGWWVTRRWLAGFAYHVTLPWWLFALAGAGMLLAAMAAVGVQAIKVARQNPVEALHYE